MISTELKSLVDPNEECCCEYHLAYKCKEWAFKNSDFEIWSKVEHTDGYANVYKKYYEEIYHHQCVDTEPEAIFKACQWILGNKDKQ